MGMVLVARTALQENVDQLASEEELFQWVSDEQAWEADKLWWAALDLLFGPGGIESLGGDAVSQEAAYSPIMRMSPPLVTELVTQTSSITRPELERRFDDGEFGDPLGPPVEPEDRDWLCDTASELLDMLRDAAASGKSFYWIIT